MKRLPALIFLLVAAAAAAQQSEPPSAILLIAKPGLADPNFRETVVLVTRTPDAQMVGVILNRPTELKLSELWRESANTANYSDAVFFGGPVMRRTVISLFSSPEPPVAPAFPVLKDVYLSMHPGNVEPLLASRGRAYRLYAGFSGWAPRQLEGELERDGWYVVAAREEFLFRKSTAGMWRELVDQVSGARAGRESATRAAIR
jgi:putative transcriptional regulator